MFDIENQIYYGPEDSADAAEYHAANFSMVDTTTLSESSQGLSCDLITTGDSPDAPATNGVSHLHEEGHLSDAYGDDSYLQSENYSRCIDNTNSTID